MQISNILSGISTPSPTVSPTIAPTTSPTISPSKSDTAAASTSSDKNSNTLMMIIVIPLAVLIFSAFGILFWYARKKMSQNKSKVYIDNDANELDKNIPDLESPKPLPSKVSISDTAIEENNIVSTQKVQLDELINKLNHGSNLAGKEGDHVLSQLLLTISNNLIESIPIGINNEELISEVSSKKHKSSQDLLLSLKEGSLLAEKQGNYELSELLASIVKNLYVDEFLDNSTSDASPHFADDNIKLATEEDDNIKLATEEDNNIKLATEEAEMTRLATEEAEKTRLALEEAEKTRLALEEAEKTRLTREEIHKVDNNFNETTNLERHESTSSLHYFESEGKDESDQPKKHKKYRIRRVRRRHHRSRHHHKDDDDNSNDDQRNKNDESFAFESSNEEYDNKDASLDGKDGHVKTRRRRRVHHRRREDNPNKDGIDTDETDHNKSGGRRYLKHKSHKNHFTQDQSYQNNPDRNSPVSNGSERSYNKLFTNEDSISREIKETSDINEIFSPKVKEKTFDTPLNLDEYFVEQDMIEEGNINENSIQYGANSVEDASALLYTNDKETTNDGYDSLEEYVDTSVNIDISPYPKVAITEKESPSNQSEAYPRDIKSPLAYSVRKKDKK